MPRIYERKGEGRDGFSREGWYIDFRWKGRRYREWAGDAVTKSDAEQFLAKRMREVQREQIYDKTREPVGFATYAAEFLKTDSPTKRSKDRDETIVEMLKVGAEGWRGWKDLTLAEVTPKMIADFKAIRLANRAPATVNKELQVIKRMFKVAVEWGYLPASPAVTVKKERVENDRERHLEADELGRLFGFMPEYLRRIATFARFTGARRGEILNLTWNDADFTRGLLTFRGTKNGTDGRIYMNDTVRRLLKALPSPIDRSQRVFRGEDGGDVGLMKLNRDWRRSCSKAKTRDFRFHDLRHQAASDLLTVGRTLNDVRDFLRHKTTAMTLRYAHLVEDRKKDTARALDACVVAGRVGHRSGHRRGGSREVGVPNGI